MKLMNWLFGPRADVPPASNRDPGADFWYSPLGRMTASGVAVTIDRALTVPVVYDCIKVLTESIAQLPFAIFRKNRDGSKERADEHPLLAALQDPNPETTSVEFFGQLMFDLATDGNFFSEPLSGRLGRVTELWRLEPSRVRVERIADRGRRYVYSEPGRPERVLIDDEIWHLRTFPHTDDGLRGLSPIHAGREAIAAAIAVQDFAARFFKNDATPPFILTHEAGTTFKDEDSKANFLAAIKRWWGGERRHSPAVLEDGWKIEKLGVSNDEAQFLETRNALGVELTRIWRVPPHKVGILDKATFSNIEQQSLEFVTDTLLPWCALIEKSIRKHLITAPAYFFEFNVAGLLRGDLKARYDAYAQGRQWGWLSVNDIRRLENMIPVAGGDRYLTPLNMAPVGGASTKPADEQQASEQRLYGPRGDVISRIINGNVVRLEDYRNVA
jgi:HK97 family phage portal protein